MRVKDIRELVEACAKARIKKIKWEGVEIVFDGYVESITPIGEEIKASQPKENDLEALKREQQEFEKEMNVLTDPLAWEKEATGHGED